MKLFLFNLCFIRVILNSLYIYFFSIKVLAMLFYSAIFVIVQYLFSERGLSRLSQNYSSLGS